MRAREFDQYLSALIVLRDHWHLSGIVGTVYASQYYQDDSYSLTTCVVITRFVKLIVFPCRASIVVHFRAEPFLQTSRSMFLDKFLIILGMFGGIPRDCVGVSPIHSGFLVQRVSSRAVRQIHMSNQLIAFGRMGDLLRKLQHFVNEFIAQQIT
jgi:hypothetical protein